MRDEDLESGGLGPAPGDLSEEGARRRPQGPGRGSADPGPADAIDGAAAAAEALDPDLADSRVPPLDARDPGPGGEAS